jgi:hypothetical protein
MPQGEGRREKTARPQGSDEASQFLLSDKSHAVIDDETTQFPQRAKTLEVIDSHKTSPHGASHATKR